MVIYKRPLKEYTRRKYLEEFNRKRHLKRHLEEHTRKRHLKEYLKNTFNE